MKDSLGVLVRVCARQQVVEGHSKSPQVCRRPKCSSFEQFGRILQLSAGSELQGLCVTIFVLGADTKVNEHRLTTVSDHDVVRLDVLMHHSNDLVTVVHRLDHVDEIVARLPSRNTCIRRTVQVTNDVAKTAV